MVKILKEIYSDLSLGPILGFKGGTLVYLLYNLPRFSVDLDFDLLQEGKEDYVLEKIGKILEKFGTLREKRNKHFTLFSLLSYGSGERQLKVEISKRNGGLLLRTKNGKSFKFERIICTLPTPFFLKISKGLPEGYKKKIANLKGFGAVNLVLSLKKQFLKDKIYWLNINEQFFPFLGIVEQTNFIDPKVYGGDRIIYISNYLPSTSLSLG